MYAEHFLEAKGYENITTSQLSDWRREHMSNLLNAFDFDNVSSISLGGCLLPSNQKLNISLTTASRTFPSPRLLLKTPMVR